MAFDDWMEFGIKQGWCTAPVCLTHDGEPTTVEEDAEFEEGSDPCIHIIRMCEDGAHQQAILENHSPSNWITTPQQKQNVDADEGQRLSFHRR